MFTRASPVYVQVCKNEWPLFPTIDSKSKNRLIGVTGRSYDFLYANSSIYTRGWWIWITSSPYLWRSTWRPFFLDTWLSHSVVCFRYMRKYVVRILICFSNLSAALRWMFCFYLQYNLLAVPFSNPACDRYIKRYFSHSQIVYIRNSKTMTRVSDTDPRRLFNGPIHCHVKVLRRSERPTSKNPIV